MTLPFIESLPQSILPQGRRILNLEGYVFPAQAGTLNLRIMEVALVFAWKFRFGGDAFALRPARVIGILAARGRSPYQVPWRS